MPGQGEFKKGLDRNKYTADFATLGLGIDASLEDVKAAYKKLIMTLHPDKVGNNPEATRKTKALLNARDNLYQFFDAFKEFENNFQLFSSELEKLKRDYNASINELNCERTSFGNIRQVRGRVTFSPSSTMRDKDYDERKDMCNYVYLELTADLLQSQITVLASKAGKNSALLKALERFKTTVLADAKKPWFKSPEDEMLLTLGKTPEPLKKRYKERHGDCQIMEEMVQLLNRLAVCKDKLSCEQAVQEWENKCYQYEHIAKPESILFRVVKFVGCVLALSLAFAVSGFLGAMDGGLEGMLLGALLMPLIFLPYSLYLSYQLIKQSELTSTVNSAAGELRKNQMHTLFKPEPPAKEVPNAERNPSTAPLLLAL